MARWVGLAAAGVGAFWLAAQWSADAAPPAPTAAPLRPGAAVASVRPPGPASAKPITPDATGTTALTLDRSRSIPRSEGELFAAQPWEQPAAPAAAAVPVPAPAAPPPPPEAQVVTGPPALPFTFVGMLEQGAGKPSAFLARGEQLVVAASGDVLDRTYRVERLSATEIVMTYLPLNIQQTLRIPEVSP